MCEYCESERPICEPLLDDGVEIRVTRDEDGSWALDAAGYYDGGYLCGVATVPIVACPMCGRRLERGQ